jgi:hypothetical protein
VEQNETYTPSTINGELAVESEFEELLLRRMTSDWNNAKQYMRPFHVWCTEMHGFYYNAQNYASLKKVNKFPSTAIQEDVDVFVADVRDKLFYAGRPATLTGREDNDRADAEAKQAMLDYQDTEDSMFSKMGSAIRDAALYRIAVVQVDYDEKKKRRWVQKDIPATGIDESGAMIPITDEQGNPVPSGEKEWQLVDIVDYKGATVKRLDPVNVFWTSDKEKVDDEYPIMVRSFQDAAFFKSRTWFFNADKVAEMPSNQSESNSDMMVKRTHTGESANYADVKKGYEYVEWYGKVDRLELYKYFLSNRDKHPTFDIAKIQEVLPNEKVWVIAGFVGDKTLVQLREEPFDLGRPNIVIGSVCEGEDSLLGVSLSQKIEAVQRAEEDVNGMLIENFRQAINPQWIIDVTKLIDKKPIINQSGGVIQSNDSPDRVASIIQKPQVAQDIYILLERFKQTRQNQGGMQDILTGQGDAGTQTLGESNLVMGSASLRMRDYLKSFEDSFVRPLYEMRNHINATFIDEEYAYRVLGSSGDYEWRSLDPETIRLSVDFICESSVRETSRAVIVQQMLQFIQIAPLAQQAGQVVRFDKMMAELGRSGFNLSEEKILEFFPFLRLEKETGMDIDQLLLQRQLMMLGVGGPLPQEQGAGGNLPQPRSENEAVVSAQARNEPQIGRF